MELQTNREFHLGCDCEGAIKAVSNTRPVTSQWNSYDILEQIKKEIRLSTVKWTFQHVYGHQDKKCKKKNLDIWATTNIAVNKEAKRKWARYKTDGFPVVPYDAEGCGLWQVTINGKTITKNIPICLYNHQWIHHAKCYWKRRFGITSDQVNMTDWSMSSKRYITTTMHMGHQEYVSHGANRSKFTS